jgi:hypothetical protein
MDDVHRPLRESAQADFAYFQRRIHSLLETPAAAQRWTRAATWGCPYGIAVCTPGCGASSGTGVMNHAPTTNPGRPQRTHALTHFRSP